MTQTMPTAGPVKVYRLNKDGTKGELLRVERAKPGSQRPNHTFDSGVRKRPAQKEEA